MLECAGAVDDLRSLTITVLSDVYDWHKNGVATLGLVKLDVGEIVDLPVNQNTLPYLQKTTSTALYVFLTSTHTLLSDSYIRVVQIDLYRRISR